MRTKRTIRKHTRKPHKKPHKKSGCKSHRKIKHRLRTRKLYNKKKGGSAWKNAYLGVVSAAKSSFDQAKNRINSSTSDAKNWSMVKRFQAKRAACKRLGCCPDAQM